MRDGVTIYFIRHGETDWNAERRYQGQRDIPLNELGRVQARRNGETLRALLPEIAAFDFVASPLGRALETMRIVRAALDLDPGCFRRDDRLMEVNYGHWEGQLAADLPRLDPQGLIERQKDAYHYRPRGGESYADLFARTSGWLGEVERDTVVVSHGGVSRTVRGNALGLGGLEMMRLEVPQDRVLVLRCGQGEWI